jgi:Ca-activated chloride channel family protein
MSTLKRDTMHLRNKSAVGLLVASCVLGSACLLAQTPQAASAAPTQSQTAPSPGQLTPLPPDFDSSDPAVPVWARRATPATPSNATPGASTSAANAPSGTKTTPPLPDLSPNVDTTNQVTTDAKGGFRFVSRVNEVTLTATVLDQRHHLVTDLSPRDFVVYEDGQPQQITSFKREDIPVSIGILVDNSGSMRTKRNAVAKAVVNLVQSSNARDEVFVVNFNDEPYLDQDFTSKVDLLKEAIDHVDSRGGTALYDAVIASADHLAKGAKLEKKVLLVVTDGEDNESRESLEQAIRSVQNDNGPTIYTIGILSEEGKQRRAKRALESLSVQTGGVAFFPKDLQEVDEISKDVARDIRNQYSITYKPTNPRSNGGYRTVKVVAHAPGYKDLQVRTRSGYFANEPAKTASTAPGDTKQQ